MKTILVTGGAGYVGSVLTRLLLENGYAVRVADALIHNQDVPEEFLQNPSYELRRGDLRNATFRKDVLFGVDGIVHLAGIVGEPAARSAPDLSVEMNRDLVSLINRDRGTTPFLFFSTTSVYTAEHGAECTEETIPTIDVTATPYAWAKYEAEKILRESDNYIIFRPATAFGISPRMRLDLLPHEFVFRAVRDGTLEVYNPAFGRTFIHVRDLARAVLFMFGRFENLKNEVYNIGSDKLNATKEELANLIRSKVEFSVKVVGGDRDPDKRDFTVRYDKLERTGFSTVVSLSEGIDELIENLSGVSEDPRWYNTNFSFS